jgi:hypothetical protein
VLTASFEVDELTAGQDVAGFLRALEEHQLVR